MSRTAVEISTHSVARDLCRDIEDESALPGKPLDLEQGSRRRERDKNQGGPECVAPDAAVLESKSELQVQVQRFQGNGAGRAPLKAAFARRNGSCAETELHQLEACQNKLAKCLLALTRRNWDIEPTKRDRPRSENCIESWE